MGATICFYGGGGGAGIFFEKNSQDRALQKKSRTNHILS